MHVRRTQFHMRIHFRNGLRSVYTGTARSLIFLGRLNALKSVVCGLCLIWLVRSICHGDGAVYFWAVNSVGMHPPPCVCVCVCVLCIRIIKWLTFFPINYGQGNLSCKLLTWTWISRVARNWGIIRDRSINLNFKNSSVRFSSVRFSSVELHGIILFLFYRFSFLPLLT